MGQSILVEDSDAATSLTLNRPEARNALDLGALQQLGAALAQAETSPSRVVVLRGAGGAFSSGGDIQDMLARRGQAIATFERLKAGLARIVQVITQHPKPVLACVDGDAVGAGAAIAIACDALVATERSRFGFPFIKVGLVPDTGSSWLLPHIVGIQQARRLLLTGELIMATEAQGIGMITQLVPDEHALRAAQKEWVQRWAQLPPTATRDVKRLLRQNLSLPLDSALLNEALVQGVRFTTAEHAQAVDAFLAKKKG